MCRHLAYLGDPVTLRELVIDPPSGLYRQSWAPREQKHGNVNVDGFGVGWYADGDPVPARYRRTGPIWADPSFADLARVTRSTALLAAVRDATEGTAVGAEAAAPYGRDRWLFSLNGSIDGWPESVAELAVRRLTPAELLSLEARCDTALIWALVLRRLREGADPADALAAVVADLAAETSARLNLLLTDGAVIAATTWGDVLGYRAGPGGVLVASEPPDDSPDWIRVPDRTLLRATRHGVELRALPDLPEPPDVLTEPLPGALTEPLPEPPTGLLPEPPGPGRTVPDPPPAIPAAAAPLRPFQSSPGRTNHR